MSSDSSDSEYGRTNHESHSKNSDSEPEIHRGRRTPPEKGSPKGPCTPRSSSPRSQESSRSPRGKRSPGYSRGSASPLSDSQGTFSPRGKRGPRSPPSPQKPNDDDDGRSDISSGSSLLSHQEDRQEEMNIEDVLHIETGDGNDSLHDQVANKNMSVPDAEDLSDVSDLDDSDGLDTSMNRDDERGHNGLENRNGEEQKEVVDKIHKNGECEAVPNEEIREEREDKSKNDKERQEREKKNSLNMDDGEQLDFEADDQPEVDKEDGEIELDDKNPDKDDEDKSGDEGELKEEDSLEEGEVTDEGDPKPEKPPVCRFFSRGACTWGVNCRFLHPGVTDKGNYTMFDVGRPMVAPSNGPIIYPPDRPPYGHPVLIAPARMAPGPYGPISVRREEPAIVESAWERGLRQAKEMMRKSTKRKETDMDFEEKKMNLSIGQDEIDKENDYYTRAASPIDEPEPWGRLSPKLEPELRRPVRVVERYEDIIPEPMSPVYEYRRSSVPRYDARRDPEYPRREKKYYGEEEYTGSSKKASSRREKMVREVIVQRVEKPREKRRPDEWSDPWMRSKSPKSKSGHRSRKTSYSSGSSSFSSRSGSRSSSNSSYSSYSRSRSNSLSRSRSPASHSRRPRTPPLPLSRSKQAKKAGSPTTDGKFRPLKAAMAGEKKLSGERTMLMNPPAPTPKRAKEKPLSPSAMRKVGLNPPPPTPKTSTKHSSSSKPGKVRSRKSRSSSGSGSSGSSSDSSRSSYSSSSSSSRGGTPPVRPAKPPRKVEINERLAAQSVKGKAMDALKVAGQKSQIKLTLKPPDATGKKRPAEEPLVAEPAKVPAIAKPAAAKKTTSRREELLKQLKAVEDAIARKRSKI